MTLTPREQIASATMIATHELVSNLTRAKSAMENLVHEMADVTALITGEGRVIWGNLATADWLGVAHDVVHEQNLSRLFSSGEWLSFASHLRGVCDGKAEFADFSAVILLEGQNRDVLWSMKPFRGVSDRRGGLALVTGHDITDILQARSDRAKMETELETAQILQQRFLPPGHILTKGLEVASYYQPAEQCSGDWWGYFDLGEDRELVCIADVTGHGAASALVTAMTQALCLSFVDRNQGKEVSPAGLIAEINDIVFRTFQGEMYMTYFAFVIDHGQKKIVASNAAHNFPLILRADREEKQNPDAIVVPGNPIGHASETPFRDIELPVNKGDRFILYTDGLTECRNPARKMYGSGTFRRSILRHAALSTVGFRDAIIDDALEFYAGQPLADDITLAIIDVIR